MKRKPKGFVDTYKDQILNLREKGLSVRAITKIVPVKRSSIDRILYPNVRFSSKEYYAKRYRDLHKKGICHQCLQKLPVKSK